MPEVSLGVGRVALIDEDNLFDVGTPDGPLSTSLGAPQTGGCSCEQILDQLGVGSGGQREFGCSGNLMRFWVDLLP